MAPLLVRLSNAFGFGAPVGGAGGGTATTPGTPYTYNSGGIISDYTDPGTGNHYRSHLFTDHINPGSFVLSPGAHPLSNVDIMVVGGGGGTTGGHGETGGSGGAGALRYNKDYSFSGGGTADVELGHGGYGVAQTAPNGDLTGGVSNMSGPIMPAAMPTPGGGAGGYKNDYAGEAGGSGGGGSAWNGDGKGGSATGATIPGAILANAIGTSSPNAGWGHNGGSGKASSASPYAAGGGGGAGAVGGDSDPGAAAGGGVGVQYKLTGPPTGQQGAGFPGPASGGGYFAGGGGGSAPNPSPGGPNAGGAGGGADGIYTPWPFDGTFGNDGHPGSGGGGAGAQGDTIGGSGGAGVTVLRYQIPASTAPNRPGGQDGMATGGMISYYNNKTIHAFLYPGDFNNTSGSPITAEVVIIGGGGGGSNWQAGGGGAGRYYSNDSMSVGTGPFTVTIGQGGHRGGPATSPGSGQKASNGGNSVFNSVTMPGGGGGAPYNNSSEATRTGRPGGSGGGGGSASGSAGSGDTGGTAAPGNVTAVTNTNTPADGAGNNGGAGNPGASHGGGGGGGAADEGTDGNSQGNSKGGPGGMAVLLPSTFRNPQSAFGWPGGPTGAAHYVAGGGGGSSAGNSFDVGGGGGAPQGDKAGVPNANLPNHMWGGAGMGGQDGGFIGGDAKMGSGSGGGGAGAPNGATGRGGRGGPGLVLIAYTDSPY